MAIVELGPTIARARGKTGGIVFSNSRSSPFLRRWSYPIAQRTNRQQTIRANHSIIAAAWRDDLTPTLRDDWDLLAENAVFRNSLGAAFQASGREWFFHVNRSQLFIGSTIQTVAPPKPYPFWPQSFLTEHVAIGLRINTNSDVIGQPSIGIIQQISPPLNASVNQFTGPWSTPNTITWPIGYAPTIIVGAIQIPVNARYFIRLQPREANGVIGFWQLFRFDVTINP